MICPVDERQNLLGITRDIGVNFDMLPAVDRHGNKLSMLSGSSEHTTLHFTGDIYANKIHVQNELRKLFGKSPSIGEFQSLNRHQSLPAGGLVDVDTTQVGIILQNVSSELYCV